MKVLIAPQAFKGTLSPFQAARAMQVGVARVFPDAAISIMPVADGGDGTLEVLINALSGTVYSTPVEGALGDPFEAKWGILPDNFTAVIELARICGLAQLKSGQSNPLLASTYGVGQVIRKALDMGCRKFLIGLGGSSTNDAGTGMAQALGVRFLDKEGNELPRGGVALAALQKIDMSGLDPRLLESHIIVACDVVNPLTGPNGATLTYASQKEASDSDVHLLEEAMLHFASVVNRDMGIELRYLIGGGSAGGCGAGMAAFLNAHLHSGIEMVLELLNFDHHLSGSDLVITGEGCMNLQTLHDKAPLGVSKMAKAHHLPVLAIVGIVGKGFSALLSHGIDAVIPISFVPFSPEENIDHSSDLVVEATEQALRCVRLGMSLGHHSK